MSLDRETLGRVVREAWVACKLEEVAQGIPVRGDHLVEWDRLPEREKEAARRIGETVAAFVVGYLDAKSLGPAPILKPGEYAGHYNDGVKNRVGRRDLFHE